MCKVISDPVSLHKDLHVYKVCRIVDKKYCSLWPSYTRSKCEVVNGPGHNIIYEIGRETIALGKPGICIYTHYGQIEEHIKNWGFPYFHTGDFAILSAMILKDTECYMLMDNLEIMSLAANKIFVKYLFKTLSKEDVS